MKRIMLVGLFIYQFSRLACADSMFGIGYTAIDPQVPILYSQTGVHWFKVPKLSWNWIEPYDPIVSGGVHHYTWDKLDKLILAYQQSGLNLHVVIQASSSWGSKPYLQDPEPGSMQVELAVTPPKDTCWDDYEAFVQALVERYDKDGSEDMPGLIYPILHYEIETEAQNSWQGTVEEYLRLLKTAKRAASNANAEAKIILAGINLGDLFDRLPAPENLQERIQFAETTFPHAMDFIRKTLSAKTDYDLVEFHFNRDYTGVFGVVPWIRQYTDKPVIAGDATSGPFLAPAFLPPQLLTPPYPQWQYWFDEVIASNHVTEAWNSTATWYRSEQASETVRKFAAGIAMGVDQTFIQTETFWSGWLNSPAAVDRAFCAQALVDGELKPFPVFYTLKMLVAKLDGFTEVKKLNLEDKNMFVYEFRVGGKKVYILWYDNNLRGGPEFIPASTKADLSGIFQGKMIKLTRLITQRAKTDQDAVVELLSASDVLIGSEPVLMEEAAEPDTVRPGCPSGLSAR